MYHRKLFFSLLTIAIGTCYTDSVAQSKVTNTRVVINANVTYTKIRTVALRIEAVGASQMILANDSTFRGATWQKYAPTLSQWILENGEGDKFVYAKFKDAQGKESAVVSDKIVFDRTPPINSAIEIEAENGIINNPTKPVKLKLQSEGAAYMMLSNQKDFYNARWEVFKPEIEFNLEVKSDGSQDGLKQVYVKFRDKGGNVTEPSFATVMIDTQSPVDEKITINNAKTFTTDANVQLALFVRDGLEMLVSENQDFADATWQPYSTALKWKLSKQGKTKIYAKFRDDAKNESAVANAEILFDNTPPSDCSIVIDDGAEQTTHPDRIVKLKIAAKDAAQILVSNGLDFYGATWQPYAEIMMWKLDKGGYGERSVYIRFKDAYGNETAVYYDKINFAKKEQ
jgi:hypothetical protein